MNNPDYKHKLPRFTALRTGDLEHGCKCNTVSNAQGRGKKVKRRYSLSLPLPLSPSPSLSLSLLSKVELHLLQRYTVSNTDRKQVPWIQLGLGEEKLYVARMSTSSSR